MIFYKYAGKSGFEILEDLRLKITPPNEFNDPFELTPRSKFTITVDYMLNRVHSDPESFRNPYENMVTHEGYPYSFKRFLADLPAVIPLQFKKFKKLYREEQIQNDLGSLDEASKLMGILCVSKPNNSIPMWSHYANYHQGVAFGLDLGHPSFSKGYAWKFGAVKYRKNRTSVDALLTSPNAELFRQMISVIFTKGIIWKYEQEYRGIYRLSELLHPPSGQNGKRHYFLNIDAPAIREIIFGCRTSPADEKKILDELNRRPRTFGHIKLFRCKRHDSKIELEIVPVIFPKPGANTDVFLHSRLLGDGLTIGYTVP